MTDQEMKILAAKAAGYRTETDSRNVWIVDFEGALTVPFIPLDDSGQAFALLVNLRMEIAEGTDERGQAEWWVGYPSESGRIKYMCQTIGDDPNKSARRTITMAAAEIGRGMKS